MLVNTLRANRSAKRLGEQELEDEKESDDDAEGPKFEPVGHGHRFVFVDDVKMCNIRVQHEITPIWPFVRRMSGFIQSICCMLLLGAPIITMYVPFDCQAGLGNVCTECMQSPGASRDAPSRGTCMHRLFEPVHQMMHLTVPVHHVMPRCMQCTGACMYAPGACNEMPIEPVHQNDAPDSSVHTLHAPRFYGALHAPTF